MWESRSIFIAICFTDILEKIVANSLSQSLLTKCIRKLETCEELFPSEYVVQSPSQISGKPTGYSENHVKKGYLPVQRKIKSSSYLIFYMCLSVLSACILSAVHVCMCAMPAEARRRCWAFGLLLLVSVINCPLSLIQEALAFCQ